MSELIHFSSLYLILYLCNWNITFIYIFWMHMLRHFSEAQDAINQANLNEQWTFSFHLMISFHFCRTKLAFIISLSKHLLFRSLQQSKSKCFTSSDLLTATKNTWTELPIILLDRKVLQDKRSAFLAVWLKKSKFKIQAGPNKLRSWRQTLQKQNLVKIDGVWVGFFCYYLSSEKPLSALISRSLKRLSIQLL